MSKLRMAQYGTKHGHAEGKLLAMQNNPQVELAGVYEPDPAQRERLQREREPFRRVHWFDDPHEMLDDPTIVAVASEGLNAESLAHTEQIVRAGKHVWYDKPAGDDWARWQRVVRLAEHQGLHIQVGYMFRYHHGFRQIAEWVKNGVLGEVFAVRAHMSTWLVPAAREVISAHAGGIFYDLAGHMLDQIVWLLGRPQRVTAFLRNDSGIVPAFKDNTLGVFEFERAIAFVDIAAMEPRPMARRFEVYGVKGSAILLEPFEPAHGLRLCLEEPGEGFAAGAHVIPVQPQTRQQLYELELEAFIRTITGAQAPDRPLSHELLVQETLLRATGGIPEPACTPR
ncbi:MAG: Gfo/Idh/MocA family oxidoreductase [Thermoflexales bacterium]|nr:Gfo/Idh/MocA family oxidoreductase [Thermoflexales bacterium]